MRAGLLKARARVHEHPNDEAAKQTSLGELHHVMQVAGNLMAAVDEAGASSRACDRVALDLEGMSAPFCNMGSQNCLNPRPPPALML